MPYFQVMKTMLRTRNITIALHVLIWSALLLLPYLVSDAGNDYRIGPLPGLYFTISGIIHLAIFYTNAFVLLPVFFNRRYWWLYIPLAALLLLASLTLKHIILSNWFPAVLENKAAYRFVFGPSFFIFIISVIYWRVNKIRRQEQQKKDEQAAQLQTELKFLRSQINPHFIFNVLTNLISLARKKSDQLEPALIRLSELMRYMLYDSRDDRVPLEKEITYLESYIELQKMRFGNDIEIESSISLEDDHVYMIEPMLLVPFVENAFKHGTDYIRQQLVVKDGVLTFTVENACDETARDQKDENSGIGLNNVKTRLHLLYKNKHRLTIDERAQHFHITLVLTLT